MKVLLSQLLLFGFCTTGFCQPIGTDSIGSATATGNIYSRKLAGDSLSTSFLIIIKKGVGAHKHVFHSEHVIVLEGEALMKMDGREFTIKKGDLVFIPKNTVHSVKTKGNIPLKVISTQAPDFDGSDRIWVDE